MAEAQLSAIDYSCGQPRKHHNLYFEDGTLVVQAERAIFKIHRSLLARYSIVIRDMLCLPSGEGHNDGTDEKPLVMNGDSALGWELLLGLQYNTPNIRSDVPKGGDLLTMLPIVHKYAMEELETKIIQELKNTSSHDGFVDLVVAAQLVGSEELYQDGLQRLVSAKSAPTLAQSTRMGVQATHAVMMAAMEAAVTSAKQKVASARQEAALAKQEATSAKKEAADAIKQADMSKKEADSARNKALLLEQELAKSQEVKSSPWGTGAFQPILTKRKCLQCGHIIN
ncbi:hypothetical protein FRC14_000682 [Serendipita sp. 396]|nr:hypothetical protein FRC14_000682 [Serendipita sp. 396]KAG8870904.1 hypothetical protein FRC20_011193 [Serendipita sp. 405]KAG9052607.1 hypothetical protein FS842_009586 [Serendipita sp. 407]